jgi:hypothetical protein
MSANAEVCSNCGTENPPGRDFCIKCGAPLTESAAEGLETQREAMREGGVLGTEYPSVTPPGEAEPAVGPSLWPLPGAPIAPEPAQDRDYLDREERRRERS